MPPLRVALIGCGIISEVHLGAWAAHPGRARVTFCCDVDPERAQRRAEQAGARAVTSFEQVLASAEVDAVDVCTPHHLHSEPVIAAARAGKHILCQKPLAKSLAECDAMIGAARDGGVVLFYGETNRTAPAAVAAHAVIGGGRIGRLIGLQATYAHWQGGQYLSTAWRYDPRVTGGGQLLDGGVHYLDLLLHLGGPIVGVSCFTARFREELGGEDTAVLNLRYADGHLGSLFSSQAAGVWFPGPGVTVFGTEGVLTLGGPHGALTLHRPDLPEGRELLLDRGGDSFAAMVARFLDTVLDGAPNSSPGEVGRDNLRLVLAAYRSSELGREVHLSEL
jgi:predicted dehydrogenase